MALLSAKSASRIDEALAWVQLVLLPVMSEATSGGLPASEHTALLPAMSASRTDEQSASADAVPSLAKTLSRRLTVVREESRRAQLSVLKWWTTAAELV